MDLSTSSNAGGRLQISSEVIAKIAKLATLEIDGVAEVTLGNVGVKNLLNKIAPQNPIQVELKDDVADITVAISVYMGAKIPEVSEKVQENVKNSVQNMTQITVAKVNIVVVGITEEAPVPAPEF
ncbi:Asp23/Gls24 family envelope stress response protein [Ruminococcaceae bacterium OttesenSCG-928-A16]|nr:Asp23/Gls24 family envelope stress response protein [Ruminococcaceae bacterium OttesenSCG-928-A16]